MASALEIVFNWAEISHSEGFSLVFVRPQWRFYQSFGASQSDQVHPQPLHRGAAPQLILTFALQGHPCCLLHPCRGFIGNPIAGGCILPLGQLWVQAFGVPGGSLPHHGVQHHHCWAVPSFPLVFFFSSGWILLFVLRAVVQGLAAV